MTERSSGFHLKDGLFFERIGDKIRIKKTRDGRLPSGNNEVMEVDTDIDGLASVMATLSKRGEDLETWNEARGFLNKERTE